MQSSLTVEKEELTSECSKQCLPIGSKPVSLLCNEELISFGKEQNELYCPMAK